MWINLIVFFLGVSILLYCLFAGADYGAGILECFLSNNKKEEQKELITHAIGPVWEANHVWLILIVVILFNGFPKAFGSISIIFHIPLTIMLLGVVLRGCAFTFRHYDALKDGSQFFYSWAFKYGSVLAAFMLGVIAGAIAFNTEQVVSMNGTFVEVYVMSWMNLFSIFMGFFTCALFTFLAAVYLIGEADKEYLKNIFKKRARVANIAAVVFGGLVFLSSEIYHLQLVEKFIKTPSIILCMVAATFILVPLWWSLGLKNIWIARALAAMQVSLILLGWFQIQAPKIVSTSMQTFTFYNSAAPESTLVNLGWALIVGSSLILPSLFFLFRIFKAGQKPL